MGGCKRAVLTWAEITTSQAQCIIAGCNLQACLQFNHNILQASRALTVRHNTRTQARTPSRKHTHTRHTPFSTKHNPTNQKQVDTPHPKPPCTQETKTGNNKKNKKDNNHRHHYYQQQQNNTSTPTPCPIHKRNQVIPTSAPLPFILLPLLIP